MCTYRIVRNRAADKAKMDPNSPSHGDTSTPPLSHSSSPGVPDSRTGYSISGILGIPNQSAQSMADPANIKRKRDDQGIILQVSISLFLPLLFTRRSNNIHLLTLIFVCIRIFIDFGVCCY